MKRFLHSLTIGLFLLVALLFNFKSGQAQTVIASWNMFGQTDYGTTPLAPSTLDANVTSTQGLTRSAGVFITNYSSTIGPNRWGGRTRSIDASGAVSTNRFLTFAFTPKAGATVSFSKISTIPVYLSTLSPEIFRIDYSINGGTYVPIVTHTVSGITAASNQYIPETPLSGITALQNLTSTTTVSFRILPFGATGNASDDNFNYFYIGAFSGSVGGTGAAIDATAFSVEGTVSSPLPVKLSSFSSTIQNQAALLKWSTESEVNFDYFLVEKKSANTDFKEIGRVAAKGGVSKTLYSFTDKNISFVTNYYRLKMVDKDGTFEYSDVIDEALPAANQKISIYPNPVVNQVAKVQFGSLLSKSTLKVIDISGRVLITKKLEVGENNTELNMSQLAKGQYVLLLESNVGKLGHLKFIKDDK